MRNIFIFFIVALVLAELASCRSTKKIQTVIAKKDSLAGSSVNSHEDSLRFIESVYGEIKNNHIDFNSFSGKIKVDFEGGDGKKYNLNVFLRMQKDSIIWASVNGPLGMEAFRTKITPDSIWIMNKMDKEIQQRSSEYLKEVSKVPFDFYQMQDLLIGNPVFLDSNITSYNLQANAISLISMGPLFKHLLTVTENGKLLMASKLDDLDTKKARTALITYGDYENKNGIMFPTLRRITASEKGAVNIEMQYKQYDFNVPLNFPFTIPKNYIRN